MILAALLLLSPAPAQEVLKPEVIRVGHWVEAKGEMSPDGKRFLVDEAGLLPPEDEDMLVGTVEPGSVHDDVFRILGQLVQIDPRTEWRSIERDQLEGARVKVEGRYHGPRKFTAKQIAARGSGRDRVGGRVDAIEVVAGGFVMQIMNYDVFFAVDTDIELEVPLAEIPLAEERPHTRGEVRNEDDLFGSGIRLFDSVWLQGQLESNNQLEDEFDLDETTPQDKNSYETVSRIRASWIPSAKFTGVLELRVTETWTDEEPIGTTNDGTTRIGETYGYWKELFGPDIDVQLGRQDFDDPREWIYDQNLDAFRMYVTHPDAKLEVAASTVVGGGSDVDEHSLNLSAYLSNRDRKKQVAAWVFYRDISEFTRSDGSTFLRQQPIHAGVRAIGEWLSDNTESWLDIATVQGRRDRTDGGTTAWHGWGVDVGTTWWPERLDPLYFSAGWAWGSGDATPNGDTDNTFRQTGLQDNNDKFGGVTSFRYYGELLEPELANLSILTAGIGFRPYDSVSLDLVAHSYRQVVAFNRLVDANLDMRPSGLDTDIGHELDLILGSRSFPNLDIELTGGWFHPGDAFPDADDAYFAKIQFRYRF